MREVVIPANNWQPRPDQMALWGYLENGGKRAVEVAHRRWGKDEIALHYTAVTAMQKGKIGNYWHLLPQYNQCRKAIWEAINPRTGKRRIDEAFPEEIRANIRNTDMYIQFKSGSSWQVVGSDNFDALVGTPPIGIVFSEYALSDPRCWAYLSPILEENGGWAAFISTSRGNNHFKQLIDFARVTPGWFGEIKTAKDTPVFSAERLIEIRAELVGAFGEEMGGAMFEQEYMCFPAGTKIWTSVGQRSIEDIAINDAVLTHTGRWRKVTQTYQRECTDELVEIKSTGSCSPLRLTGNHPVRVCDPSAQTYDWVQARAVKTGDYVVLPRIKCPGHSIIDAEFAELIAWFIAEGSVAKNFVHFSLNKKEITYAERIRRIASRFGKATIRQEKTAQIVVVNSCWLADFLTAQCGFKQDNRRIPWQLIAGHEAVVYDALLDGDGCRGDYCGVSEVYTTISYSLALDVQMLAHVLGKRAHINKKPAEKQTSIIEGRQCVVSDSYAVRIAEIRNTKCGRPKILPQKHGVAALVTSVENVPFSGQVYNFAVQFDESYVAEGRTVHNCSFEGLVMGSFYGKQMTIARNEGRITRVPHETGHEVYTFWDLGVDDSTSIWFVQAIGREYRVIDYYEATGMGLEHYAKILKGKDYAYGDHYMPHDAAVRELSAGEHASSRVEVAEGLGIRPITVVERARNKDAVMAGIEAVRNLLGMCWFDEIKCAKGISALEGYKSEYDEDKKVLRNTPLHDWCSHGADSFRTFAVGFKGRTKKAALPKRGASGWGV